MSKIMYYSSETCQPCKVYGPLVFQVAKDEGAEVEKVLIEEIPFEQFQSLDIQSVPMLICGERRLLGARNEIQLRDWINSCLAEIE